MKNYLLKLADDSFYMGHRMSEWCGVGPYLEEDIAIVNIALDQLGQANNFYNYAAQLFDDGRTADDLAFLRYEHEYYNAQFVELPNEDYAHTILKVYVFSVYQKLVYDALSKSADEELAAIATKSLKEVRYHYTHAISWMRIFAGGTEESQSRLKSAVADYWEYTQGLFAKVEGEEELVSLDVAPDMKIIYEEFQSVVKSDFADFGLEYPEDQWMQHDHRNGVHTEYFGYILCETQYLQRAYPGCKW